MKSGSKSFFRFFSSSFSTPISIWRMLTSHVKLLSFSPLTLWWLPFVYLVSILLSSLNSSTTSSFHHFVSVFSWNKFWTEKENNFHFLKREYFLSVIKRCLSFISKGNRFQSLKLKFIRDGWIDFVFSVFLNLISFASWMDLRSFYSSTLFVSWIDGAKCALYRGFGLSVQSSNR